MTNNTTRDAAQTVASVESQLRHLQLQHVEAQNRLQEFTLVAGELARRSATSRSPSNASGKLLGVVDDRGRPEIGYMTKVCGSSNSQNFS